MYIHTEENYDLNAYKSSDSKSPRAMANTWHKLFVILGKLCLAFLFERYKCNADSGYVTSDTKVSFFEEEAEQMCLVLFMQTNTLRHGLLSSYRRTHCAYWMTSLWRARTTHPHTHAGDSSLQWEFGVHACPQLKFDFIRKREKKKEKSPH